jgi:hypothetical protein
MSISPAQFKSRWLAEVVATDALPDNVKLVTATAARLAATGLAESAGQFLAEAGLPKSCAPCLTFEEVAKGLPRIWDLYSPTEWSADEKQPLEHYLMLGADGSDNPICVDERDGKVVLVDHELLFDPIRVVDRIQFINSSIPHLAECLLVIHALPEAARRDSLRRVDPPALEKGAFWSYESNVRGPDQMDFAAETKKPWWKFW